MLKLPSGIKKISDGAFAAIESKELICLDTTTSNLYN